MVDLLQQADDWCPCKSPTVSVASTKGVHARCLQQDLNVNDAGMQCTHLSPSVPSPWATYTGDMVPTHDSDAAECTTAHIVTVMTCVMHQALVVGYIIPFILCINSIKDTLPQP